MKLNSFIDIIKQGHDIVKGLQQFHGMPVWGIHVGACKGMRRQGRHCHAGQVHAQVDTSMGISECHQDQRYTGPDTGGDLCRTESEMHDLTCAVHDVV